jgi:hypothetical protein
LGHYIADIYDLEFNLFEVLKIGGVLGSGRYRDLDVDTVRTMLDDVAPLAEGPVPTSGVRRHISGSRGANVLLGGSRGSSNADIM